MVLGKCQMVLERWWMVLGRYHIVSRMCQMVSAMCQIELVSWSDCIKNVSDGVGKVSGKVVRWCLEVVGCVR